MKEEQISRWNFLASGLRQLDWSERSGGGNGIGFRELPGALVEGM